MAGFLAGCRLLGIVEVVDSELQRAQGILDQ